MSGLEDALDGLKNPAYTGENRCPPCTVLNVLLAISGTSLLVVASSTAGYGAFAPLLGGAFLLAALGSIYFRGYLVPGTPALTKRYLPASLLRAFGKAADARGGVHGDHDVTDDSASDDDFDVEQVLVGTGALRECRDGEDLCLTDAFATDWRDQIDVVEEHDVGRDRLLELLDVSEADVSFEEFGSAFRARIDGRVVGTWQSRAAFVADVAAAESLRERDPSWPDRPVRQRGLVLDGLRLFLEECPACGESLSLGVETVESCCSSHEVVAVTCDGCTARLFESRTA